MIRNDVIKTYLTNFNLYKHLLSMDKQKDDHKKLNAYLRKEYRNNNKRVRHISIKKHGLNKKYYSK